MSFQHFLDVSRCEKKKKHSSGKERNTQHTRKKDVFACSSVMSTFNDMHAGGHIAKRAVMNTNIDRCILVDQIIMANTANAVLATII